MFCPVCHTENRDNAKFCKGCGKLLQPEPSGAIAIADRPSDTVPAASMAEVPTPDMETAEVASPKQEAEEADPSLAPTLILSPDRMMEYHQRLWQRQEQAYTSASNQPPLELAREGDQPVAQPSAPPEHSAQAGDIAEQPTLMMDLYNGEIALPPPPPASGDLPNPGEESAPSVEAVATQAAATETTPADAGGAKISAPASLSQTGQAGEGASAEPSSAQNPKDQEQGEMVNENINQTNESNNQANEQIAQQNEQPEVSQETSNDSADSPDFPPLASGTMLQERFEVKDLVDTNDHEHIYHVVDHQGYQHCWNCGSEQNTEEDEFCMDCGAELLGVPYILHEYHASGTKEDGSNVLQGTIVNTFVEDGKTYAVEQEQVEQNPFPMGVRLMAASDSDAGDVRRSEPNEDSTLVLQLQRVHESRSIPMGAYIVADGMGGHDYGQVASRMAINIIADRMTRELLQVPLQSEKNGETIEPLDEDALVTLLHNSVQDANAQLCQKNQRDKTDMGSTITGFMIVDDRAYILNVGDSRTYMLRGGQLYQLTTDHSLVGQLVAGGLIQPDDVYTHPQRSQIFRSLGDKLNVQIDIFKQQLHPGDILLSCSDGLWEMVRNPAIETILKNAPNPQSACTQLLESANANGGDDNVSAVVVFAH